MPRFEARYKVIEKLKSLNCWRETQNHEMVLPLCSRSGDVIEPMLREQWFVRSSKVFEICDQSIKSNQLKLIPKFRNNLWEHYVKAYTTKDWCISRQLWWGQTIPAYKCAVNTNQENFKWFAAHNEKEARVKAKEFFKTDKIVVQQGADRVRFGQKRNKRQLLKLKLDSTFNSLNASLFINELSQINSSSWIPVYL